ncbi:hypothetical protein [Comamonas composti]|uniref:hypothetical protein n=1 Tax=Comamonas composti TaxID=408558 RepID=UPI00047876EE|nr:hypothetical protein [Comamonas composti]
MLLSAACSAIDKKRDGTKTLAELRRYTTGDLSAAAPAADVLDAMRYRWLRERDLDTLSKGGVFAGMTPNNVVLNGDDLDDAIDAAIAARADKGE